MRVTSETAGAMVAVNGEERGTTPCDLDLPPGNCELRLSKKYHESRSIPLTVNGAGTRDYKLTRVHASVPFESEPPGAQVFVDGVKIGETPLAEQSIPGGTHKANFVLEGYYEQTVPFEVLGRDMVLGPVKATLLKIPPGRLVVECDVDGAEVWLNAKLIGRAPVVSPAPLPAGQYRIRVLDVVRTVRVEPGQEMVVRFTLNGLGLKRIPAGKFWYGISRAKISEVFRRTEQTAIYHIDMHEVTNALDQTNKEVGTRFDLKNTGSVCRREENIITVVSDSEFHLEQVVEVLRAKLAKRKVPLKSLQAADPIESGKEVRQAITVRHGIAADLGKKIVKIVKETKNKTQASIQEQQVRVTGKKRDELQAIIALLKEADFDLPLQFKNFRD